MSESAGPDKQRSPLPACSLSPVRLAFLLTGGGPSQAKRRSVGCQTDSETSSYTPRAAVLLSILPWKPGGEKMEAVIGQLMIIVVLLVAILLAELFVYP